MASAHNSSNDDDFDTMKVAKARLPLAGQWGLQVVDILGLKLETTPNITTSWKSLNNVVRKLYSFDRSGYYNPLDV